MLLRHCFLLLFFLFILCILNAQLKPYTFSYLTVDQGLSHTDAKQVMQDKKGFIWIATLFGLDRFDGYHIKHFANNADPANVAFKNRIRSLFTADDGLVWLSTEDGIHCFDSKTERFIQLNQNTFGATYGFHKIAKLKNNRLIQLSQDEIRVFIIDKNTLKKITLPFDKSVRFFDFIVDSANNVWLASSKGVWLLDSNMKITHFNLFFENNENVQFEVSKIAVNKKMELLLIVGGDIIESLQSTVDALHNKSAPIKLQKRASISNGKITDVLQDAYLNYWVSSNVGLFYFDKSWQHSELITNKSQNKGLSTNYLDRLYTDRSGCLWVCTFGGGVNITDLNAKLFYTIQRNPESANTLPGNHIRAIAEEDENNIWIGTNSNGISHYNLTTKQFENITTDSKGLQLKSNEINALVFDKQMQLWIASNKGIQVLNKKRMKMEMLDKQNVFSKIIVENLAVDFFGNIWFGSYTSGLGCILKNGNQYQAKHYNLTLHQPGKTDESVNFVYADKDRPELLVATIHGLERLTINESGDVTAFNQIQMSTKKERLSSNFVWPVQRQNDSIIWVGTLGGGLNKLLLNKEGVYTIKNYNVSIGVFNDVESLQIDESGNVWMGGRGLQCFKSATGELNIYDANDGLQGNSFKVGASFKGKNGRLYFGGINGLNYFNPSQIQRNSIAAVPVITDITSTDGNKNTGEVNAEKKENAAVSYAREVVFPYSQNNFIAYFSSMHFANPKKCRYRYKLEGYETNWNYTSGERANATYANLNNGSYRFLVEACNNDGAWSDLQAKLNVIILPPWWKSNTAKLIYLLLSIALILAFRHYLVRWYRLKKEFAIREIEESKREELHRQKESLHQQQLQFFTNISHEFRTPLTLIMGPVENLLKRTSEPQLLDPIKTIYRNANRMMNLISELMNFRKVADMAITLQVTRMNVRQLVQVLADEFSGFANEKDIRFSVAYRISQNYIWADQQIIEKILYNLLGNAVKYTPAGGTISLEVNDDISKFVPEFDTEFSLLHKVRANSYLYFIIKDTGVGLSEESIGHIFNRYYRVSDTHIGSGVGLALVKNIVDLHRGDIYVYSKKNKGTEFIVGLPAEKQSYSSDELMPSGEGEKRLSKFEKTSIPTIFKNVDSAIEHNTVTGDGPRILVVEDNEELKVFLKESLEVFYQVAEASNGKLAMEVIAERKPDLIISDIMMPVMNGIELCQLVKENLDTSHIPLILLTAKGHVESQVEGLSSGADYYISKPFSVDVLLLTIKNLLVQRNKIKQMYANGDYGEAIRHTQSSVDKQFMTEFFEVIEGNIENEALDVDFICKQMHISRSKLYNKVKEIADKSVGDFIRTARLKKAIEIMSTEDVSIQDVVDRVGLVSSSYFSKAFKKEFGKSPYEFLKSHRSR